MNVEVNVPPQNLEVEEAALGAAMVAEGAARDVVHALDSEDFYRERHRIIFDAIAGLYEQGEPVDALTVSALLAERGKLTEAGGKDAVSELASTCPAPGNAGHYAAIIRDRAAERGKRAVAHELTNGLPTAEGIERLRALEVRRARRSDTRVADLSRVRPIRWAWGRRLPIGYLSLLLGAEGIGKGTVAAWIIARLTRGELPGDLDGAPCKVLALGDEDSFDSVLAPRLYAAGADLSRVETLDEAGDGDLIDLRRDGVRLRELVRAGEYRLVYIDALLDVLGLDVDDWRSKAVRDALRPLRRMARDLDVAALGSLHPNKGQRGSFRDLVSGSHAFNASSRSSLLLAEHPDDEGRRVLVRGKGNLSAPPPSFEFRIEGRELEINDHGFSLPVVGDVREGELGIEDVLKPDRPAPVRDTLREQIDARCGDGEIWRTSDIARAVDRGPTDSSVRRALGELEDQNRWENPARGQWRRIVIATSKAVAMSQSGEGGER